MKKVAEFFTDDSGKLSGSRLNASLLALVYAVCALYIAFDKSIFTDVPVGLAGLIVGLYGINKFSPTIPFGGEHK